jgi:hypothetical protein
MTRFEVGRAADARKWVLSDLSRAQTLHGFIARFSKLGFYRAAADDDLEARAGLRLPSWYRVQRRRLIGPFFDEPGGVADARLRFTSCDFALSHAPRFCEAGDRDWFLLTHFGYSDDEERRLLLGACGLWPIGVRFGYHFHLAVSIKRPDDQRIFAVHLDEIGRAREAGQEPEPQAAFRNYASMLQHVGAIKNGAGGKVY